MEENKPYFVGVTVHADEGRSGDLYPGHPLLYIERYTVELIRAIGLEPYLIPMYKDSSLPYLKHLSGLVFTGGGYLDLSKPLSEGGSLESTGTERYEAEKKLIEYGLSTGVPIIGICRGAQMINSVLGGKLSNILDSPVKHHQEKAGIPGDQSPHSIKLNINSKLYTILLNDTLNVNSFHRQHITELGAGLVPAAVSIPDNLIEAFESKSHPFLYGFQFHPEKLYESQPVWQRFFQKFAKSIREFSEASFA
ncbi:MULTISPECIES: gamma-glutamyl-gamma-aminobutyrate hydrolase family protein [Cytobacillus]|uniref:gamma-glutamyl-gamma-aminobutyrate hydrolase family protein n=1 Tax=Cytobacillus TaxID=2675230 RepID=UPI00203D2D93|nr:gamma-glutamyl-gamma-aminobutyrate hydrolase family protein [Cytobacillus firmus]MCM3706388.1 gamma-glutamyl-gamma-aminobutyrate hydrolase family protein [Cytobacillus firmus]